MCTRTLKRRCHKANYQYSVVGFFMQKNRERIGKVTRKELEAYKVNERLIERNMKKIEDEKYKDIPTVYGKVRSSMNEHPYIETHMAVQMEEPVESDRRIRNLEKWEQEVSKAKSDNTKVEEFIDNIDNATIKEIFVLRYIEGKKVSEVAKDVGYTHGRVSQIISKLLKD